MAQQRRERTAPSNAPDGSEAPQQRHFGAALLIVVLMILGAAGVQFLWDWQDRGSAMADASASAWMEQHIEGLGLAAPGRLQKVDHPATESVEQVPVEHASIFQLEMPSGWVGLTHVRYEPSAEIDLDGIARTMIQQTTAAGAERREYGLESTEVSGREAREIHAVLERSGEQEQMRGLLIRDGQDVWQLVVVSPEAAADSTAERILTSVRILDRGQAEVRASSMSR